MTTSFVGLGSNLDNPAAQLQRATRALDDLPHTQITATSNVYRSAPLGPQDQPDFLNAVVALNSELTPLDLLDALQAIEAQQGRKRGVHWGPRTLDLDLLLYGEHTMATARLTLPHPHMHQRAFVLLPLRDVCDDNLVLPNGLDLVTLLQAIDTKDLEKTQCRLRAD